jgi:hypothetical protein
MQGQPLQGFIPFLLLLTVGTGLGGLATQWRSYTQKTGSLLPGWQCY